MNYRSLGHTGLQVSPLCFGTMTFGREADRATSAALFHRCREAGINFFDCADLYAQGESERILGELIRDCRDEVVITSKAYYAAREEAPPDRRCRAGTSCPPSRPASSAWARTASTSTSSTTSTRRRRSRKRSARSTTWCGRARSGSSARATSPRGRSRRRSASPRSRAGRGSSASSRCTTS